ncbi:hydroxymethylpyrimidine/phosphomethylpyrimidine kinase [Actibacterium sp. XHP0104]|uniref:hydroxymethylpyrimidine/phosphomethylpyrimidine kinase n=1 Tax=Actibacterium sp. XHP0104 TaxID=2984335 RepID=UPI0021E861F3|nr:hydroxymethylpyrimidine/phosphomethylpyrimidine kinase [Actibacterium sp. XHP0104]MCV2880417.1 hydroxymethylpyrimidine/phosphomethylpyrimidine kinase [Actibacterium sp. XHP0104]
MTATVLCIGGMDSSGGAGLLRDAEAVAKAGAAVRVAVTAVTAQDDRAVTALHPVPPDVVSVQIAAAGRVSAVKTGMLCNAGIVEAIAKALPPAPLIIDPVIAASSGRALLDDEGIDRMLSQLLPRAVLLTPNLPELNLLGRHIGLPEGAEDACVAALIRRGCGAVLVKGGHGPARPVVEDRLYLPDQPPIAFPSPRIAVALRGTGCFLASAIAAHLAAGRDLTGAVDAARAQSQRRFETAAA